MQYNLGTSYDNGLGVTQDATEAATSQIRQEQELALGWKPKP